MIFACMFAELLRKQSDESTEYVQECRSASLTGEKSRIALKRIVSRCS